MHLDHLSYAAGPEGLAETVRRLSAELGASFQDGGFHPRFGTRNATLPLTDDHYLEVVEVLDHPAADKAPFGRAVRARTKMGGGWMGWVIEVDDLSPIEARVGRPAVEGHRFLPDGTRLVWEQLGVLDLLRDPQLPFFVRWLSSRDLHPSVGGGIQLLQIELSGSRDRIDQWVGGDTTKILRDVDIAWTQPDSQLGLLGARFSTPRGEVRL